MQLKPTNQKLNVTHVDFETFAALIVSVNRPPYVAIRQELVT